MSEYQVIARKWRPQCFADVVGQEHLTRTLRNAIMQNRTAHAYLLVGPRGIGKTTTARILAKALNCSNPQDGEPCCQCSSCLSVADGTSLDIIEIDAASQNSVDDVRVLREQVMFSPVNSRYKIYIVDEVHMLSKQAWNAFLKTLEEPPPHVKFIFATTEVQKVLPTIISRCQRFDLRRIPTPLIVERLDTIAKSEKIPLSKNALEAIARAADGGMRDAQSLMDQVITFFATADSTREIDENQVFSLFGLTSPQEMDSLIRAVFADDRPGVIRALFELSSMGRNLETLLEELTDQLRAVLITMTVPDAAVILEATQERIAHYRELGNGIIPDRIQTLLESLTPLAYGLRNALNKQVYLETALLKAMKEAYMVRLDDVIARIHEIRKTGDLKPLEALPFSPFPHLPVTDDSSRGKFDIQSANMSGSKSVTDVQISDCTVKKSPDSVVEKEDIVEQTNHSDTSLNVVSADDLTPDVEKEKKAGSVSFFDAPMRMATSSNITTDDSVSSVPLRLLGTVDAAEWPFVQSEDTQDTDSDAVQLTNISLAPDTFSASDLVLPDENTLSDPEILSDNALEPELEKSESSIVKEGTAEVIQSLTTLLSPEVSPEVDGVSEVMLSDDENLIDSDMELSDDMESWHNARPAATAKNVALSESYRALNTASEIWHALVEDIVQSLGNPVLASVMKVANPDTIEGDILYISFDQEFESQYSEKVMSETMILENRLRQLTNQRIRRLRVRFQQGVESLADHYKRSTQNLESVRQKAESNPFVQEVVSLFGGQIVDVHG